MGPYSSLIQQPLQGPPGQDGEDGTDGVDGKDGADAPGSIIVGILDPDQNDSLSGIVEIRAVMIQTQQISLLVYQ